MEQQTADAKKNFITTIYQEPIHPYDPQDKNFDAIEPYKSALNFYRELEDSVNANYPIIFINCLDNNFIKRCIKNLTKSAEHVVEFSFGSGRFKKASWKHDSPKVGIDIQLPDKEKSLKDFYEILFSRDGNARYEILLVHGFNSMLRYSHNIVDWLKLAVDFHANREDKKELHSIIVVEQISNIPIELVPYSKILELPPPDYSDIKWYYLKFLKDNGIKRLPSVSTNLTKSNLLQNSEFLSPQGGTWEITDKEKQLFDALRGFYPVEIITLLKSISVNGYIDIALNAKKDLVKKTPGLKVITLSQKEEVGGLHNLQEYISETKKLLEHKTLLTSDGFSLRKGILLVGMPGCGKSLSAKLVASKLDLPLYQLEMGCVLGSMLGESEANFQLVLQTVERVAPCVLWLDEMEKAFSGLDDRSGVMKHILGKFLTWLQDSDGSVFVFATANDISNIPPELKRKGRFDKVFSIQLPDAQERAEILKCHLKKISCIRQNINDSSLDKLCYDLSNRELWYKNDKEGRGVSGADIAAIVKEAYCKALLKEKMLIDKNEGGDSFLVEAIKHTLDNHITQRDLMNVNSGYEKALKILNESGFEPA